MLSLLVAAATTRAVVGAVVIACAGDSVTYGFHGYSKGDGAGPTNVSQSTNDLAIGSRRRRDDASTPRTHAQATAQPSAARGQRGSSTTSRSRVTLRPTTSRCSTWGSPEPRPRTGRTSRFGLRVSTRSSSHRASIWRSLHWARTTPRPRTRGRAEILRLGRPVSTEYRSRGVAATRLYGYPRHPGTGTRKSTKRTTSSSYSTCARRTRPEKSRSAYRSRSSVRRATGRTKTSSTRICSARSTLSPRSSRLRS